MKKNISILFFIIFVIFYMPLNAWQDVSLGTELDTDEVTAITMTAGTLFVGTGFREWFNNGIYRATGLSNTMLTLLPIGGNIGETYNIQDLKITPISNNLWVADEGLYGYSPHISTYNSVLSGPPFTQVTSPGVSFKNYQASSPSLNSTADRFTFSMVVDRTNSNHILAATANFIGETFDGGNNWRAVPGSLNTAVGYFYYKIYQSPANANYFYVTSIDKLYSIGGVFLYDSSGPSFTNIYR